MCAIVDADVVHQSFGKKTTAAGIKFREWIESDQGELIVGGKNLRELEKNNNFGRWFVESRRTVGRVRQISNARIDPLRKRLEESISSNDSHVLALALASGARLLYTNDRRLMQDFTNPVVISKPEGKIYTTLGNDEKKFTTEHRELLETRGLCGSIGRC